MDTSPLVISLATTCAATIATFLLGLIAARFMYQTGGSFRAWIDGVLTLPLVLPPTVVGFFLLLIFGRRSLIGHALEHVGITIAFSWPATVIAATVIAFPLMYRTTLGAFDQVNPGLLQAARTLGATEWIVFRRVLLPLAGPGVIAGTVLAFARALGEFGATLMLAGNIPGRTQTMPIAIFSAAEGGDMHAALLWVVLIVVISLAIVRLLNFERRKLIIPLAEPESLEAELLPLPSTAIVRNESNKPAVSLEVDLKRKLENFTLKIALDARKGAVGLLGASGAGKSMTLQMIAGVSSPDKGRIVLNGRVLFDSSTGCNIPAASRRIGVVFQDYALFPHLTVSENVGFALMRMSKSERHARILRQLDSMGIAELANHYPHQISGGQRQRVAIARCMAMEPDALLLDEPFAALDPHLRRRMEEQLRETLAGFNGPVLFVTHDMEEAFRFCSELLVLDHGCVIARGPKLRLFERPCTVAAAQLTGCKNIAAGRRSGTDCVEVDAWGCRLRTTIEAPQALTHVGFRSHQMVFQQSAETENTFSCWLMNTSEAPHEMTLYLRLHAVPCPGDSPHMQADVSKEVWNSLSAQPQPWRVTLDPARILLLEG